MTDKILNEIKENLGKSNLTVIILAALILLISANIIVNTLTSGFRFDLTSNNIYTLSKGTKNILRNLEEPLHIRFFYSEKESSNIPQIQSYANHVRTMFKQYSSIAGDDLELEFIDPEAFSEQEDMAVSFGIQGIPLNESGGKLYFGAVISNSVDGIEVIPFFNQQREAFLEYDLTNIIYDLSNPKKNSVALINGLETSPPNYGYMMHAGGSELTILDQIKEQFKVETLEKDIDAIPDNFGLLALIHPTNLSDDTLYAIDQFVLNGGKLLVFVDPHSELPTNSNKSSNLDKLFSNWGVALEKGVILDRENAMRTRAYMANSRLAVIDKLNWISLDKNYLNSDDIITAQLGNVNLASSGHLAFLDKEDIKWTPLITSSEIAMEVMPENLGSEENMIRNFISSNMSFTLAGRISGKVKTAFPDKKGDSHLSQSKEDANIIIVADTDMLRDQFWLQKQSFFGASFFTQLADNGAFVINSLENLSGSSDLIGLRSRTPQKRPFKVVDNLRRQAEARFLEEEQRLQQKLAMTERKLSDLSKTNDDGDKKALLSKAQQQEISNFRQEILNTRKELRKVKHSLNKGIEGLGSFLKFIHIGLIPISIIILGLFLPRYLGIKKQ